MNYFQVFLGLTTTACYLAFFWSVAAFFTEKKDQYSSFYLLLKLTSASFWLISLYLIYIKSETSYLAIVGITFNIISFGLFFISANAVKNKGFSTIYGKDIPEKVFKGGPYKYVRNPFYLSYLLCYLGISISLKSIVLGILLVVLYFLYIIAIRFEENKFIYSPEFYDYYQYKKTTGKIFPKLNFFKKSN